MGDLPGVRKAVPEEGTEPEVQLDCLRE